MSIRSEAGKTWKLSGPIIFGELTQLSLGIIDNIMVGVIDYKNLAAASLVNAVINIPFVVAFGITMSISQMVSMANGRKNGLMVSHYLFNGFWLCTIVGILIALLLDLGKNSIYYFGQDPEVATLSVPYLQIMGWSIVPMVMFIAVKQFTDGLEKTYTAMILSLLALPVNVALNWMLIYGNLGFPELGLVGAGYGTLITRIIICIALLTVVFIHPMFKRYVAVRRSQWKLKVGTLKSLLQIGIPSGMQVGMESGAFAVSGILIGTLGAVEQAAHQIALNCAAFTFMVSLGLAQGGSIRVSNAFGRSSWMDITSIGKSTLIIGLGYGVFCALFFVLAKDILPLAFTEEDAVISLASTLLLFAALFQISDATQAIGVGLLRGIKDVKISTLYVAIAYWVLGIPVGCLMAFVFDLGAIGMWIGFVSGLTFSSILLNRRFFHLIKKIRAGFISKPLNKS